MSSVKKLTLSGVLVALSVVLVLASELIPSLPNGGKITLASMVPVIFVSLILGTKWGLISSVCFSLIQIMTGFYPPPVQNFISFLLVIMLDYVIAFGGLGLAGLFKNIFGDKRWSYALSGVIAGFIRYICHIISGIVIWGVYAPEGQSVLWYSLTYNGSYMIPEIIISGIVIYLISPFVLKQAK